MLPLDYGARHHLQLEADSRTTVTIDPTPHLQLDANSMTIATIDPASDLQLDADSMTIVTIDPASDSNVDLALLNEMTPVRKKTKSSKSFSPKSGQLE